MLLWSKSLDTEYDPEDCIEDPLEGVLWEGTGVDPGAGRPKSYPRKRHHIQDYPDAYLMVGGQFSDVELELQWFFVNSPPDGTLWVALLREVDNDSCRRPELLFWLELGRCTVSEKSIRIPAHEIGVDVNPFKVPLRLEFRIQPEEL
jgi:hypothetical protein